MFVEPLIQPRTCFRPSLAFHRALAARFKSFSRKALEGGAPGAPGTSTSSHLTSHCPGYFESNSSQPSTSRAESERRRSDGPSDRFARICEVEGETGHVQASGGSGEDIHGFKFCSNIYIICVNLTCFWSPGSDPSKDYSLDWRQNQHVRELWLFEDFCDECSALEGSLLEGHGFLLHRRWMAFGSLVHAVCMRNVML